MPNKIQKILEKHNITPNKVLGQNFLLDEGSVKSFIEAAEVTKEDIVVEVGPGTGVITKELAKYAGEVIAVEKDPNMVKILQEELKEFENVEIIEEDILKFEMTNDKIQMSNKNQRSNPEKAADYKLVGAPPYYLTGRLFRKFLEEADATPSMIAVIIQKEVAEKICARPPDMSLPAVSVQLYGEPKIIKTVPKNCFWPVPKVDSAILLVKNIQKPDLDEGKFFKIVRAGFSSPRKQLLGNLSRGLDIERFKVEEILKNADINPERRAQTLSIEEWKTLAKTI